jgi:hypothetical protein
MTDDLEPRLRDSLRTLVLPGAPATLRDYLSRLPTIEGPSRARALRTPQLVAAAVAVLVVALGAGMLVTGIFGPASTAAPTPSDMAAASYSASPGSTPPGMFVAPGITFDIPEGWSDQTSSLKSPSIPGFRYVGLLARGMTFCHTVMYSTPAPTAEPTGCNVRADQPGSALLFITEFTHQYPWPPQSDLPPVAESPYPAWGPTSESTSPSWLVQSPDRGLFFMRMDAPPGDLDTRVTEITSMLTSLQLSAWQPAPEVVDGRVHVETQRGFSFDYPAGWTLYYPQDFSTMDSAVATVASSPLEPPCPGDACQRFSTPPETVAIEFRIGGAFNAPDWSTAPTTIGGQPAFGPEDWGPQNATSAEEAHSWSVRLSKDDILGIGASLRGPGLPALRTAMDEVLASILIGQ